MLVSEQGRVLSGQGPSLKRACCSWVKPGSVRKPNLPDLGTAKLTPMGFTRVQPTYDVRGEVENLASEECGYSSICIYDAWTTTDRGWQQHPFLLLAQLAVFADVVVVPCPSGVSGTVFVEQRTALMVQLSTALFRERVLR